jgi:GST-like protein
MTLYGHVKRQAPNTFKLLLALAEAKARYDYVTVDLAAGAQKRPDFLALNPHGKIPVLVDARFVLPESDAILWYIAEKFPAAGLLARVEPGPAAAQARARVLQWCDFVSSGVYQAYLDLHIHTRPASPDQRVGWIAEAAAHKMDRLISVMDGVLSRRAYLADDFSIADLSAAAVLQQVKARLPRDPSAGREHLVGWYARVTARPSWQSAALSPGCDGDGRGAAA